MNPGSCSVGAVDQWAGEAEHGSRGGAGMTTVTFLFTLFIKSALFLELECTQEKTVHFLKFIFVKGFIRTTLSVFCVGTREHTGKILMFLECEFILFLQQ